MAIINKCHGEIKSRAAVGERLFLQSNQQLADSKTLFNWLPGSYLVGPAAEATKGRENGRNCHFRPFFLPQIVVLPTTVQVVAVGSSGCNHHSTRYYVLYGTLLLLSRRAAVTHLLQIISAIYVVMARSGDAPSAAWGSHFSAVLEVIAPQRRGSLLHYVTVRKTRSGFLMGEIWSSTLFPLFPPTISHKQFLPRCCVTSWADHPAAKTVVIPMTLSKLR